MDEPQWVLGLSPPSSRRIRHVVVVYGVIMQTLSSEFLNLHLWLAGAVNLVNPAEAESASIYFNFSEPRELKHILGSRINKPCTWL